MDQLQWAFSLIPDSILIWIYYTILAAGLFGLAAGWIIKWIPGISAYKGPLQLAGVVLTAGSLYLLGGYGTEMKWRKQVAEMQSKVDAAEAAAATASKTIETKVEVKTKVIREKGKTQIEYVDRVVTQDKEVIKYVEQCPVPKAIIDAHNAAAEMNKAAESKK